MTRRAMNVPKQTLYDAITFGDYTHLSDETYLKWQFALSMNKNLNLEQPKTFNEKLQWLKLYDRKPLYTKLVDKYLVRDFISEKIGEDYLIPIYGVYDNYQAIDFGQLPEQFVLKMNHTSGGVYVIEDKATINHAQMQKEVTDWLATNYYWQHREWPYKNVQPKIIIEQLMVDQTSDDLKDYKFFCFDGEAKLMYIASERSSETKFDFYDMAFNHLDLKQTSANSEMKHQKPENFEQMIELAETLSKDIPHVRVDLYEINGQIYFGEMTFYHMAGNDPFEPESMDETIGEWIQLPKS